MKSSPEKEKERKTKKKERHGMQCGHDHAFTHACHAYLQYIEVPLGKEQGLQGSHSLSLCTLEYVLCTIRYISF